MKYAVGGSFEVSLFTRGRSVNRYYMYLVCVHVRMRSGKRLSDNFQRTAVEIMMRSLIDYKNFGFTITDFNEISYAYKTELCIVCTNCGAKITIKITSKCLLVYNKSSYLLFLPSL